ncbi:GNAT family N-acetyltransferase [Planktothricoides raciborskii]|uniref:GNAT family N-acetyltransferase n=2 Tax=Planktothricoides raciborskii TaxID=132608 RepID=A0AAU8JJX9_9CYAN|nr:GNAT family N-acetyltransferase [Planktothricoides raciborskii]MBD2546047.1 GNAT family N-acetyltransferase [Planktothricoides raciborskii FACHB-1370]MBD2584305.1 GNAT family N-acetyltransferase [Planktothricoides raciborskii FACHB-1261]
MIEIRLAQTPEEKEQVFKLRYQIYVKEMGYQQQYANHKSQIIEEPLDESGNIFVAFQDNKVVGTVRNNYARQSDLGYYVSLFKMSEATRQSHLIDVSVCTKFMVIKNLRRTGIGFSLMQFHYNQLLLDQIKFDFIDCEPHMIPFFQKLGYQTIDMINHPEYGSGMAMILDVFNLKHLQRVKSPFMRLHIKDFNFSKHGINIVNVKP